MFVPRRRPLMRAAMMGGAGYMVGKRAQKSSYRESEQEERISELEQQQQQQAAPQQAAAPAPVAAPAPAAAPAGGDLVAKLGELKGLLDAGALTQAEFDAAKAQVLQGA